MPTISKAALMGAAGAGGRNITFDENDVALMLFDETVTSGAGSFYCYVTDQEYVIATSGSTSPSNLGFGPLANLTESVGPATGASSVLQYRTPAAQTIVVSSSTPWTAEVRMYNIAFSPGNGLTVKASSGNDKGIYSDSTSIIMWNGNNVQASNLLTSGAWHHLVVQHNGGNNYSMFCDGIQVGGSARFLAGLAGTAEVYIGDRSSGGGNENNYGWCDFRFSSVARYPTTTSASFTPSTVAGYQDQY